MRGWHGGALQSRLVRITILGWLLVLLVLISQCTFCRALRRRGFNDLEYVRSVPIALLRETAPGDDFDLVNFASDDALLNTFSSAHCWGAGMDAETDWKSTACWVKNLCFDRTRRKFLYYQKGEGIDPMEDVALAARGDDSKTRFRVEIVKGETLPDEYLTSRRGNLWILQLGEDLHDPTSLVWDNYLSWFMLASHVLPLEESVYTRLRPISVTSEGESPYLDSCTWASAHSDNTQVLREQCHSLNAKWLPFQLGRGSQSVPQSAMWLDSGSFKHTSKFVCLRDVVVGAGAVARRVGESEFPLTFGRGPLLRSFQQLFYNRARINPSPLQAPSRMYIFFSENPSSFNDVRRLYDLAVGWENEITALAQRISSRSDIRVEFVRRNLEVLSVDAQVALLSNVGVYVGEEKSGSVAAQFLPPGSGAILFLEDGSSRWELFNSWSWLRTDYQASNVGADDFKRLLLEHVAASTAFRLTL